MMKKLIVALLMVLLGGALIGNKPQSIAGMTAKTPAKLASTGWEQEWAKTLAQAKQEGTVSIAYVGWTQETATALARAFKDKYGISIEYTSASRGNELASRLQEQQRAGLSLLDFVGGGTNTSFSLLKPAGLLGSLEPLLILPEVKDPKSWRGGHLPYVDKDKTYIAVLAQKLHFIIYNTDLIKPGEITTYKDLLKPQYKGKITLNDPTATGPGAALFSYLAHDIWTMDEAKAFLRHLIVDQQAVIQRDPRLQIETVAKGKYSVALAGNMTTIEAFLKIAAPIDAVIVKEGFMVAPAVGGISVSAKLAHPNAAKVFLNWFLSKEGLTLFASTLGGVSTRADVPVDAIRPLWRFYPGEKLFSQTEESIVWEGQIIGICKQVIDEATKK